MERVKGRGSRDTDALRPHVTRKGLPRVCAPTTCHPTCRHVTPPGRLESRKRRSQIYRGGVRRLRRNQPPTLRLHPAPRPQREVRAHAPKRAGLAFAYRPARSPAPHGEFGQRRIPPAGGYRPAAHTRPHMRLHPAAARYPCDAPSRPCAPCAREAGQAGAAASPNAPQPQPARTRRNRSPSPARPPRRAVRHPKNAYGLGRPSRPHTEKD